MGNLGQSLFQLDALNYSIHTGHAVTDVVVNGKFQRAKDLNNALNNALEACEKLLGRDPEADAFIRAISYCRQNMFLIEIENSYDGVLLNADSGQTFRLTVMLQKANTQGQIKEEEKEQKKRKLFYILTKTENFERAIRLLERNGYLVIGHVNDET